MQNQEISQMVVSTPRFKCRKDHAFSLGRREQQYLAQVNSLICRFDILSESSIRQFRSRFMMEGISEGLAHLR